MDISVRLIQFGSEVNDYSLRQGSTVGDLFEMAGEDFVSGNVSIRQSFVSESTVLADGDKVYLGRALKGNDEVFDIEFFKIGGGRTIRVGVTDGATIKDAIALMRQEDKDTFYKANGEPSYEFRIGGIPSTLSSTIPRPVSDSETQRIFCSQKLKGNPRRTPNIRG